MVQLAAKVAAVVFVTMTVLAASPAKTAQVGNFRGYREFGVYVSNEGSDEALGDESHPLRTVQAAIDAARPGETIWVRGGVYRERPDFRGKGSEARPIQCRPFPGERATLATGMNVSGSHYLIRDFRIEPGSREPTAPGATQIYVTGDDNVLLGIVQRGTYGVEGTAFSALHISGSNNEVRAIDFSGTGALVVRTGTHNTISGGTIHHTGGQFAVVDGADHTTIERLTMHDSGQIDRSSDGSDGIDLNARHLTIRGNKIYRMFTHDPTQHVDALQWWNNADDLLVEGNVIGSRASGGMPRGPDAGHIMFSNSPGTSSRRVTIRNNVFLGGAGYYSINSSPEYIPEGSADGWRIVGNTFYNGLALRGDFFTKMRDTVIANNLFTAPNSLQLGSASTCDYNAYLRAAAGASDGPNTLEVRSAGFANPDLSRNTDYGVAADFSLLPRSPLRNRGISLPVLREDASGQRRIGRPSIGAYE